MKIIFRVSVVLLILIFAGLLHAAGIDVTKRTQFTPNNNIRSPESIATAFNTTTGERLVVWQAGAQERQANGRSVTTYGKLIDAQGNATKKMLPKIAPPTDGSAAAYNPITQEYLVVFSRKNKGDRIFGLRLDRNLKANGPEFQIITTTQPLQSNVFPHVLFNPQTNGYVLTWEIAYGDETGVPDSGLWAVQLDLSGRIVGDRISIKKDPGTGLAGNREFDFKMLPSQRFLILFVQRSADYSDNDSKHRTVDYWVASFNPMLKEMRVSKLGKYPISAYPPYDRYGGTLGILPNGSALAFYRAGGVCNDTTNDRNCTEMIGGNIVRRSIDSQGKISGPASPAYSSSVTNHTNPTVAYSSSGIGLLISYPHFVDERVPSIAMAQVLGSKGELIGNPVALEAVATDPNSFILDIEVVDLPAADQFIWFAAGTLDDYHGILKFNVQVQH